MFMQYDKICCETSFKALKKKKKECNKGKDRNTREAHCISNKLRDKYLPFFPV